MPYEKLNIQITIKLDEKELIPDLLKESYNNFLNTLKILRETITLVDTSRDINVKQLSEEMTVIAKRHTCSHDVNPTSPCIEEDI